MKFKFLGNDKLNIKFKIFKILKKFQMIRCYMLHYITKYECFTLNGRGERGHTGHVPGWTSSITDGGDEEKKITKLCKIKNFITNIR